MGSYIGVMKATVDRLGMDLDEWESKVSSGFKYCYLCKSWVKAGLFGVDNSRSDGYASTCKQCSSYKSTASRYQITIERARKVRSGKLPCEICGRKVKLEVDHDHDTGIVRGFLCGKCNKGLGMYNDSIQLLKNAISYLEKNKYE